MLEALDRARLGDWVRSLPDGLDTRDARSAWRELQQAKRTYEELTGDAERSTGA